MARKPEEGAAASREPAELAPPAGSFGAADGARGRAGAVAPRAAGGAEARDAAEAIEAIEAAVLALRRSGRRGALARLSARRGRRAGAHAALPDAVFELLDAVAAAGERGGGLTVTEAAAALGVDQPRSSRLAAQALAAGLLRREADQRDGRRSPLRLTAEGREVLGRIREFRRGIVAEATAGWAAEDRATLARLLTRFLRDFGAVTGRGGEVD
ncbi:MarR family winged helix-turn-helix transcriptional regulator [Streptomyces hoynatensis]|uniref:MarR family winged helix-turn-helix transcriptional regulator n=1 Tax=Streptomyces hoynatensis TaxID=1141874 RepID=UPI001F4D6F50|nr:MarR family winged helix-turn-helix transcriptional regulator [Streptomyces hoynatensis]